jgi:hypothetical protein
LPTIASTNTRNLTVTNHILYRFTRPQHRIPRIEIFRNCSPSPICDLATVHRTFFASSAMFIRLILLGCMDHCGRLSLFGLLLPLAPLHTDMYCVSYVSRARFYSYLTATTHHDVPIPEKSEVLEACPEMSFCTMWRAVTMFTALARSEMSHPPDTYAYPASEPTYPLSD